MSPFALALLCLLLALFAASLAAARAAFAALRPPYRRAPLACALGFSLFALQQFHTLELAWRTGLFDLRQAALSAGIALFLLPGLLVLMRGPRTPPPR